jgi:hypothetical protein
MRVCPGLAYPYACISGLRLCRSAGKCADKCAGVNKDIRGKQCTRTRIHARTYLRIGVCKVRMTIVTRPAHIDSRMCMSAACVLYTRLVKFKEIQVHTAQLSMYDIVFL